MLAGSLGLFVILGGIMFISRKITMGRRVTKKAPSMLGAFCIIPGILFAHNHIKVLCQFGFQ